MWYLVHGQQEQSEHCQRIPWENCRNHEEVRHPYTINLACIYVHTIFLPLSIVCCLYFLQGQGNGSCKMGHPDCHPSASACQQSPAGTIRAWAPSICSQRKVIQQLKKRCQLFNQLIYKPNLIPTSSVQIGTLKPWITRFWWKSSLGTRKREHRTF